MPLSDAETYYVDLVKSVIQAFQAIPTTEIGVPQEQGADRKRSRVRFTFGNWNTDYSYQLYLNDKQTELKENVDYTLTATSSSIPAVPAYIDVITTAGSVFALGGAYDGEVPVGSWVEAKYRWKYFNDETLLKYLMLGLNRINMQPPTTSYLNLDGAPGEFTEALVSYAVVRCYERLLTDSLLWNNRLIWADADMMNASTMMSILTNRLAAAEKHFDDSAWFAKPRSFVKPKGITSAKFSTRQRVTGSNFMSFAIGGF